MLSMATCGGRPDHHRGHVALRGGAGVPAPPGLQHDEGWRAVRTRCTPRVGLRTSAQLVRHAGRIPPAPTRRRSPRSAVRPAGEVFTGRGPTRSSSMPRARERRAARGGRGVRRRGRRPGRRRAAAGQRLPAGSSSLPPAHRCLRRGTENRLLRGRGGPGRRRRDRRPPGRHPRSPERRLQRQRRDRGGRDLRRPAGRPQAAGLLAIEGHHQRRRGRRPGAARGLRRHRHRQHRLRRLE